MALHPCADCGREVSDLASACPQCGRPLHPPQASGAGKKQPILIEKTSKTWKRLIVLGAFLIVLSLLWIDEPGRDASLTNQLSGPLGAAGVLLFLWGVFGAWWHHG